MPLFYNNPWTAWKVGDTNQILDNLLYWTQTASTEENTEEDIEELKKNYLTWWAKIDAAFSNDGEREWMFWVNYKSNSLTKSNPIWFMLSPATWLLSKSLWWTSDSISNRWSDEKTKKAAENAEVNANLAWDEELANVENTLWQWVNSWLSTEETMLEKEAIENKMNDEWWRTNDLKIWWKSLPANMEIMNNNYKGATPMIDNLFDYDTDRNSYNQKLQTVVAAKKALEDWLITQKDYEEYYNDLKTFIDPYLSKSSVWKAVSDSFWWVDWTLEDLISTWMKNIKLEWELDDIDPSRIYWREWSQVRIADWQKKIMQAVTDSLNKTKNSTYDKQIYNSLYSIWSNRLMRYNNSINYVWTIMRDIVARAWWDPTKIEGRDKEIYSECMRILWVYDKFVENLTNLLAYVPNLKDPNTWKIVMPDIINWKTLHEWLFDGLEDVLYKDSDFAYTLSNHNNISDIDVLENMVQSLSYDYNYAHPIRNWYKTIFPWTAAQYWLWTVVWWQLTEWEQELLWSVWTTAYNTVASEASEINYAYLNQDFTDLVTVNTHDSTSARTVQRWAANAFEYLPEIWWALWEVFLGGWVTQAAKATNLMKVLRSQWLRRTLSQAMRYAWNTNTTKVPWIWRNFKNTLKNIPKVADSIVKEWWVNVIKGWKVVKEWLDDVTSMQRLSNNLLYDLWMIEWWMDAYFDSRFADADLEQGSDISFIWSLWWTLAWTYLPWLYRTWLFSDAELISKEIANSLYKRLWMKTEDIESAIKSWWEWWAYNLMKLSENSKYNPLDSMAKAQYWLNSSKLASLEQLQSMWWMMSDVVNAFTDVYRSLNPAAKEMTDDVVKNMMWQYMEQIFWADSQMARRIWQLVADKRANPADIYKYTLRLRWNAWIWPWRSSISLVDNAKNKFVNFYNEELDLLPSFQQWWFSRWLSEWFTSKELKELKDSWYSWADLSNFKENKDWRYLFTSEWLDNASKDIDSMSMDVPIISKVTDSSQTFDKLMRNNNLKKISDETLTEITASWAYDTVANALWELDWLCNLNKVW